MEGSDPCRPLRVLVVDDHRDSRDSLSLLLGLWGHEARAAADGPSALAEAAQFVPDAVLLDVAMPGLDGLEVARRMRRLPGLGHALIVATTGLGAPRDVADALGAGCDWHMLKPLDLDELERLLRHRRP
jgi:CheY-like chemotaxis protein